MHCEKNGHNGRLAAQKCACKNQLTESFENLHWNLIQMDCKFYGQEIYTNMHIKDFVWIKGDKSWHTIWPFHILICGFKYHIYILSIHNIQQYIHIQYALDNTWQ